MSQHILNRAPSHPYGKTIKMITRTALLSFALSTTALVSATAHASPAAITPPSLVQSNLSIEQTVPKLNVGLAHGGFNAISGQPVTFMSYWNYDSYIQRGEVIIYDARDTRHENPIAVIPVSKDESTVWTPHGDAGKGYSYVLRAYGHDGAYDETRPRHIRLSDKPLTSAEASPRVNNIFRQDNTGVRNIQLPVGQEIAALTQISAPEPVAADPAPLYAYADPVAEEAAGEISKRNPFTVRLAEAEAQDLVLSPDDIHMSFDGLSGVPILNAGLADGKGSVAPGEEVLFETYWNYNHWVDRAEIRIYDEDDTFITAPVATLSVDLSGQATWTVPASLTEQNYSYVLRVYDAKGRFDETGRKSMFVTHKAEQDEELLEATGIYGVDATAIRNIAVNGGAATVSVANIHDYDINNLQVFGYPVAVDPDGNFAVQQILPSGEHNVSISYVDTAGRRVDMSRPISIPENEFFFVGIGDLTAGRQGDAGRALVEAGGEDFDQTFVHGRAAFYLKGKVKGKYLITASLDTTEDDICLLYTSPSPRDRG